MHFTLILENESGDQVDMITTANRYMTSEIDGLYPPALNNAFIEKRNLVITFQMRGIGIEKRRHELYKVVKPSRYIKVYYRTSNIDVYIEGYVETCEISNFEQFTRGKISIICPDIYWYSTETQIAEYSQILGDIEKGDIIRITTKTGNKLIESVQIETDAENYLTDTEFYIRKNVCGNCTDFRHQ